MARASDGGREKVQDAPPPASALTPEDSSVDASSPGTMSAGAEPARSSTALHQMGEQRRLVAGSSSSYSESKTRLPCEISKYVCSAGTLPSPALNNPGESPSLTSSAIPVAFGSSTSVT